MQGFVPFGGLFAVFRPEFGGIPSTFRESVSPFFD